MWRAPPDTVEALLARALSLEGLFLGELAAGHGEAPPSDLRRAKGWIGQLLERELGAEGGLDAAPDFPSLGVELKSIPVDAAGRPRESTWVCSADADVHVAWERSLCRAKLAHVLWVPIVGEGSVAPGARVVGRARLWRPDAAQWAVLRADWEAHVEALSLGELWQVDARRGVALQVRPKAARGADTHWVLDEEGEWVRAQPKGFYLRRAFTAEVLRTAPAADGPTAPVGQTG